MTLYQNFWKQFSKFYEIFSENFRGISRNIWTFSEIHLENIRNISQNLPRFYLKFFERLFEIFPYNSPKILVIYPGYFPNVSQNFPNFLEVFLEILRNFTGNFLKCISRNFPKFLLNINFSQILLKCITVSKIFHRFLLQDVLTSASRWV